VLFWRFLVTPFSWSSFCRFRRRGWAVSRELDLSGTQKNDDDVSHGSVAGVTQRSRLRSLRRKDLRWRTGMEVAAGQPSHFRTFQLNNQRRHPALARRRSSSHDDGCEVSRDCIDSCGSRDVGIRCECLRCRAASAISSTDDRTGSSSRGTSRQRGPKRLDIVLEAFFDRRILRRCIGRPDLHPGISVFCGTCLRFR